jgi:hypothetical protein
MLEEIFRSPGSAVVAIAVLLGRGGDQHNAVGMVAVGGVPKVALAAKLP